MSSVLMTCRDKNLLERTYVPALRKAGWLGPLCILTPGDPIPDMNPIAGVLLSGGGDIHPKNWDPQEPVHPTAEVDEGRDALEIPIVREAWRLGLPILGICRGEQMLNVALGGSLVQDVPSHFLCETHRHSHGSPEVPEVHHSVSIEPASRLAQCLGCSEVQVNSRHHQAAFHVAPVLKAVAWHPETRQANDLLIEAVEAIDETRWVFGVQWHPENLVDFENATGQASRRLFEAFVQALQPPRQAH